MQKTCANSWCKQSFEVTAEDFSFLEKVSPVFGTKKELIPPPTLCPECRMQRRYCFGNETNIYRRQCDFCSSTMISAYSPTAECITYCPKCFWSDQWDALEFGQEIDFSQSIMQQLSTIARKTPRIALENMNTENSEYCHRIFDGRNNYYSFIALYHPEDLLYTYYTMQCRRCVDIGLSQYSELCYQTIDAERSYACAYSQRIRNCHDSYFLQDCTGCSQCFGCKNLHQKSHCIFNEQVTPELFEKYVQEQALHTHTGVQRAAEHSATFFRTKPSRATVVVGCEDVSGDHLFHCSRMKNVYNFYESEHMSYCVTGERCSFCMDCYGLGVANFCYECCDLQDVRNALFCMTPVETSNCLYCIDTFAGTRDCFACVSMKKRSYCILNRQYTKDEYESLVPQIIQKMRKDGEWGEFFPPSMSPYGYNETVATEHFPLAEEHTRQKGFSWSDFETPLPSADRLIKGEDLPDSILDIPDDILHWAIECEATKRPFKIIKPELDFYHSMKLPIPRLHPNERHRRRMALRNPRKLWNRTCAKCHKPIATSHAPDRPEIVYCEECYLKEVY